MGAQNTLISFDNLRKTIKDYGAIILNEYKEELIKNNRTASKNLINSLKYNFQYDEKLYEVSLTLEDYWKYVENDTKPHFPPVDKIMEWVKVKPILPYPDKNGKLPTEKQLAFLIARKISEVGTKGSHDLSNTLEAINDEFTIRIGDALEEDIRNSVGIILGEAFNN